MRNWFFEQMAMYSAYHMDRRNQATHHIGVPMIVFSLMVLTATVPVAALPAGTLTLAGVLIAVLMLFYIIGSPLVGVIGALIYGALLFVAEGLAAEGVVFAVKAFASLFIVGWIIQFTGHIFEGRKPALFDNLVQVFIAPAFLIAEVLFMLGLEKGLKAEVDARAQKYMPQGAE